VLGSLGLDAIRLGKIARLLLLGELGQQLDLNLIGGVEPSDLNPQVNLSAQEEKVYEQTGVDANGKPTFGYIAKSAFNPYRTLNLSGPSPLNLGQALKLPAAVGASSVPSYAVGGTVTTGGLRDLYATSDSPANPQLSRDGFGIGRLDNLARQQAMTQAQTTGYAEGGVTSLNLKDLPSLNLRDQPSLNVNTGEQTLNSDNIQAYMNNFTPATLIRMLGRTDSPQLQLFSRLAPFAEQIPYTKTRFSYAKGGYLDGQGDGMSDSIPATIEGKQPARLADGEFVVPADVVSHLGNGSSKAGSKRLYAMLDKVRRARTGTKRQGKQINPNQFLPA
jgi:hypothetical protein